jgi:hypothetical protein
MNYKDLCISIQTLAETTAPNAQFVSGLRQRLDETLQADLSVTDVVWLIDVMALGSLPSGSEATQIKIGFGTRYNKQDLSQDEATKIGYCQDLAYAFIRSCYRDFDILGAPNSFNLSVAYEGAMFTEFVGMIATITVASKLSCWDFN